MNRIESEKDYQAELLGILRDQNGYTIRKATDFDRRFAIDREMLFGFLNDTQPETMEKLRKIHKDRLEDTIVSFINAECTKKRGSLLEVLRHGVELSGHKLELMFTKPATTFNKDLMRKYEMNRFTVMEEVWANDKERIDVVIFLNGFAIISMEDSQRTMRYISTVWSVIRSPDCSYSRQAHSSISLWTCTKSI